MLELIDMEDPVEEHEEITLDVVKQRSVRGIAILTVRGFALNIIAQIAQIFLLAFLVSEQIGVFWIISAAVSFLIYFSDIGLAAALIQKKEKPTDEDLKTTFAIQQLLILTLLVVLFLISPFLTNVYSLTNDGKWLLYALGVSLFLSSLKSIPSVLLERKLEFGRLVVPELIESAVYNVILVFLAWKGFGIRSFTVAVLARGIVGVIVMYVLMPWKPGLAFSIKSLKGLLKFGVPYQINTLIALVKDQGVTLILGAIIGSAGVGYVGTAQRLSQIPLRLFMDSTTRVSFPAFSRMQKHKEELAKAVTRSLLFITFLVFPTSVAFLVMAPVLIDVFPKYHRWDPAIFSLTFMTINTLFAAVTTQLTNMFTAIGKISMTFKLMVMWSVLTLILVPVLSLKFGFNGAAMAYGIVGISSIIAIYLAKRHVNFSLKDSALKTLAAASIMGVALVALRILLPHTLVNLGVMAATGVAVYGFSCFLFIGPSIVADVQRIIKTAINK